jgi:copper ion binding protein
MAETRFHVVGMTCGHCVNAVQEEVGKLGGVSGVSVDLESGAVTVTSSDSLNTGEVQAAVEEAGYELAAG